MTTKTILLGTGSPRPNATRYQPATALLTNGQPYVIDCGAGIMYRISAFNEGGGRLDLVKLTRLFLTHLHPDHTAGLADFMITPWIMGRREPLQIYGPKGTKVLVEGIMSAYEQGINAHKDNGAPTHWPLLYDVFEYTEGVIYSDDNLSTTAFSVDHGVLECYGFEFKTADSRIVMSGDTNLNKNVIRFAKGCDLLVHEGYSVRGLELAPEFFPKPYFKSVHASSYEIAEVANQAQPKQLVINHVMTFSQVTDEAFLKEITDRYAGQVVIGNDLDVFE